MSRVTSFKVIFTEPHLRTDPLAQCDWMARLQFQYLAVYNIENLTNIIRNLAKSVQNFAKFCMGPLKSAKVVQNFA